MKLMKSMFVVLLGIAFLSVLHPVSAQDADRTRLTEKVEQLTRHAAVLRAEYRFDEAAEVDAEIRYLCLDKNPRLIRANDLKRRSSESLLQGKFQDAAMYNREADRILDELKTEFQEANAANTTSSTRSRNEHPSKLESSELDNLKQQIQQMATELRELRRSLDSPQRQLLLSEKQE